MRTKAKGRHGVVCRLNCVTMSERLGDELLVIYGAIHVPLPLLLSFRGLYLTVNGQT